MRTLPDAHARRRRRVLEAIQCDLEGVPAPGAASAQWLEDDDDDIPSAGSDSGDSSDESDFDGIDSDDE